MSAYNQITIKEISNDLKNDITTGTQACFSVSVSFSLPFSNSEKVFTIDQNRKIRLCFNSPSCRKQVSTPNRPLSHFFLQLFKSTFSNRFLSRASLNSFIYLITFATGKFKVCLSAYFVYRARLFFTPFIETTPLESCPRKFSSCSH